MHRSYRLAISITALCCVAAMAPGNRVKPPVLRLSALSGIESGQWELRDKQAGQPTRRICLGDPAQLIQLQHPGRVCTRYVVSDASRRAVVTYQCTDVGQGRTDLRVETPRLIQIDSQGVSNSAPFALNVEARKTGECH